MSRPKNSFSSDLTYTILLILRHSLVPTRYISFLTGEPSKKISTYLSILKRKGLVKYENGFWTLTSQGEKIADKLESLFKFYPDILHRENLNNYLKNVNNENKETKFIKINLNYSKKFQRNLNLSKETSKQSKITLDQLLEEANRLARKYLGRELDGVEKSIVEFLYEFYRDTGRKYWWPEDSLDLDIALAEALSRKGISISSTDIVESLRALRAAGIVYTYKRQGKIKLRINRALLP